jgi:hypothetical protein
MPLLGIRAIILSSSSAQVRWTDVERDSQLVRYYKVRCVWPSLRHLVSVPSFIFFVSRANASRSTWLAPNLCSNQGNYSGVDPARGFDRVGLQARLWKRGTWCTQQET